MYFTYEFELILLCRIKHIYENIRNYYNLSRSSSVDEISCER
jgi:hypothetical protein